LMKNALAAKAAGLMATSFLLAAIGLPTIGGILWLFFGFWLLGHYGEFESSRRTTARQLARASAGPRDSRPPILYLRNFGEDGTSAPVSEWRVVLPLLYGQPRWAPTVTFEESIAKKFRKIGPMVALARPLDDLPELGAHRISASDQDWQTLVKTLAETAALVVFRAGDSPALWWECALIFERVPLTRILVFLQIGDDTDHEIQEIRYRRFREKFTATTHIGLPARRDRHPYLIFDAEGRPSMVSSLGMVRRNIQRLAKTAR
jgi:hypothetical protein